MKYRVRIVNVATGVPHWHEWEETDDWDLIHFLWTEHNASCDCNRVLMWARAAGDTELEEAEDGKADNCGPIPGLRPRRFMVDRVEFEGGEVREVSW